MIRQRTAAKILIGAFAVILVMSTSAPPAAAIFGVAVINPIESNIAAKPWVKASADSGNAQAGLATDEALDTAWIADDPGAGHWLRLDLGGRYDNLRKAEVVFPDKNAVYRYRIEGSTDGSGWDVVANRTSNARTAQGFVDLFSRPGTRYLRVTITGTSPGAIVGIRELKVFNYLRDDIVNGADMSGLDQLQYRNWYVGPNQTGAGPGVLDVVKDRGMDLIRLRIWNQPRNEDATGTLVDPAYQGPDRSADVAKLIKTAGLKLGIDFHYSDSWADPSKQPKPQAWAALPFNELVTTMHDFTYDYVTRLKDQGTTPDKVAVGNEIINGFLFGSEAIGTTAPPYFNNDPIYTSQPGGGLLWKYWGSSDPVKLQKYNEAWDRFTTLLAAGIKAVREASPETQVEIHAIVDKDKLPKTMEFWSQLLTRVKAKGANPDVLAISYYPEWHGTFQNLEEDLHAMASTFPGYKIDIAETAYPASGWPPGNITPLPNADQPLTIQGQANMIQRTIQAANDVIDNRGTGVLVWEPQTFQTMFNWVPYPQPIEPYASIDVFKKSFAKQVLESRVYVTTVQQMAPALPDSVRVLTMSDGSVGSVPVTWSHIDPALYGSHGSFTVTGTTQFGSVTADVSVIYDFAGFRPPLANLPTMNTANAGTAKPLKFSLDGDQGLAVFADGYPVSQQIACDTGAPIGSAAPTSASGALTYDPATGEYKYTWKTAKSWAGTCRQVIVKLDDGTDHRANFRFVK
jgi:Arabinogalactan endo-1,4-beta-galactosidase